MASGWVFCSAVLFAVIIQFCKPTIIDLEREKANERLLKTFQTKYAKKTPQEIIREGAAGLPEHKSRLAYLPKQDELDCSIRYLAYNYSKTLLNPSANFKAISDGLQLQSLCGITPKLPEKTAYSQHRKTIRQIKSSTKFLEFFVDAKRDSTSTANLGSKSSPFKKIATAIHACQYKRNTIKTHCIIQLREGTHFLEEPLSMTAKHSNILLTKYKNENAVISGGKIINTSWTLYKSTIDEHEGQNAIFEGIKPHESSGSVVFMGLFQDANMCKFLCEHQTTCTTYTYFDKTAGDFANMCYARKDGLWNPVANSAATSGKIVCLFHFFASQQARLQSIALTYLIKQ